MATVTKPPTVKLGAGFGNWLRGTRNGLRISLQDFALKAGLAPGTVRDFELGHRVEGVYNIAVFVRIADALGVDLGYVLHKAGFDLGADGISLTKLNRVEAAVEAFHEQASDLRTALSEAMAYMDVPTRDAHVDALIVELGRGLAALDRVTERLARGGFVASAPRREAAEQTAKPWSDAEVAFLRDNPQLSHEDAARHLGRSFDAVRVYRQRNLNGAT